MTNNTDSDSPPDSMGVTFNWLPSLAVAAIMVVFLALSFLRHHVRFKRKRTVASDYNERQLNVKRPRIKLASVNTPIDDRREAYFLETTFSQAAGSAFYYANDISQTRPFQPFPRITLGPEVDTIERNPHRTTSPRSSSTHSDDDSSNRRYNFHPVFSQFKHLKPNYSQRSNGSHSDSFRTGYNIDTYDDEFCRSSSYNTLAPYDDYDDVGPTNGSANSYDEYLDGYSAMESSSRRAPASESSRKKPKRKGFSFFYTRSPTKSSEESKVTTATYNMRPPTDYNGLYENGNHDLKLNYPDTLTDIIEVPLLSRSEVVPRGAQTFFPPAKPSGKRKSRVKNQDSSFKPNGTATVPLEPEQRLFWISMRDVQQTTV